MSGTATISAAEPEPVRRFNLGDALVLVLGLAISLTILTSTPWFSRIVPRVKFWLEAPRFLSGASPWPSPAISRPGLVGLVAVQMISEFHQFLESLLIGATLVLPIIRLRRPRPEIHEVLRQPGFVTCLAVILVSFLMIDVSWGFSIQIPPLLIVACPLLLIWPLVGLAPWRPEATWVDRLGRAVGWGWIVVAMCTAAVLVIP